MNPLAEEGRGLGDFEPVADTLPEQVVERACNHCEEIQILHGACDWYFFEWRNRSLAWATLRPVWWSEWQPATSDESSNVVATATSFGGDRPMVSEDAREEGPSVVAVLTLDGQQAAGSASIMQAWGDAAVNWAEGVASPGLNGRKARLRF